MKWWDDLWLNEAFARFMEYKGAAAIEPYWMMKETFVPNDFVKALHADESEFTHSIAVSVKDPNEIDSLFDDITYAKGGSCLRMLESWMDGKYGSGFFLKNIHGYLVKHAYQNAEGADLWKALKTSQDDVGKFMNTWIGQSGFPIVSVTDLKSRAFKAEQKRFFFNSATNLRLKNEQLWAIPLSFSVFSNSSGKPLKVSEGLFEFTQKSREFDLAKAIPSESVLLLNMEQNGFFRTLYPDRTYFCLLDWLKADPNAFPEVERAGFLSDVMTLTLAGRIKNPVIALEALHLLAKEKSIFVWETALSELQFMKSVFSLKPTYGLMIKFESMLISNILDIVGWRETSPDHTQHHVRARLRATVLQEAVRNQHAATISQARSYFEILKTGGDVDISPDAMGAVYDAGVMYGNQEDYEWVQQRFLKSNFAPDQQIYLHALASSPVPHLQTRTLEFAISANVRKQDVVTLLTQVASLTPLGHVSVWIFLMDNWDVITGPKFARIFDKFNKLLQTTTASFTSNYLIHEAEGLFLKKSNPKFNVPFHSDISVRRGLETAKQLLSWREEYGATVNAWLVNKTSG
jgi:aminopeptidase N